MLDDSKTLQAFLFISSFGSTHVVPECNTLIIEIAECIVITVYVLPTLLPL